MIKWFIDLLGMGDSWTLELMGVSIILETLLILDAIWFCLLVSDAINDYFVNRRRHARTGKEVREFSTKDASSGDELRYK